jgi:hypothetical protein
LSACMIFADGSGACQSMGTCPAMKKFLDTEQTLLYSAAPIVGL